MAKKGIVGGNTFGKAFAITTFGESHGKAIGVIIDGCPPGLALDEALLQRELDRRRPGQSKIVTQRQESDRVEVLSGLFAGRTTGMPIAMVIHNADARSKDYSHIADKFRPSHADYTYQQKYGFRDYRGGGRSSARETAARVAAGAVARQLLAEQGIAICSWVDQVGDIALPGDITPPFSEAQIEANPVRCPHPETAEKMEALIRLVRKEGDTIGGVVKTSVTGVPPGWGEPVFDKLHADLGKAVLSINACKGFAYGSGFAGVRMRGSAHNDLFYRDGETVKTRTNHSGGIQGGISNGMEIYFSAAFKPVATIVAAQDSVNEAGDPAVITGKGRHDPCVVPRAVPIVEAMTALVLADHWLRQRAITGK